MNPTINSLIYCYCDLCSVAQVLQIANTGHKLSLQPSVCLFEVQMRAKLPQGVSISYE